MKPVHSSIKDYIFYLKEGNNYTKSLSSLIRGKYYYRIYIHNPNKDKLSLTVSFIHHEKKADYNILTDKLITKEELVLDQSFEKLSEATKIQVTLNKGSKAIIYLPVSPIMSSHVLKEDKSYYPIAEEVTNHFKGIQPNISFNKPENTELREITVKPLFHGCLSLPEAEKQLDYVIHNKLFKSDNSKGLAKLKLSLYRSLTKAAYNALTSNTNRKRYFAKIYRNYINNSIISENAEKLSQ